MTLKSFVLYLIVIVLVFLSQQPFRFLKIGIGIDHSENLFKCANCMLSQSEISIGPLANIHLSPGPESEVMVREYMIP